MSEEKKKTGFATISKERQREIAAMGGKAVRNEMRSFSVNRELARAAGRKGGAAVPAHKRTFSNRARAAAAGKIGGHNSPNRSFQDPEVARVAGRKGGKARHAKPDQEPGTVDAFAPESL